MKHYKANKKKKHILDLRKRGKLPKGEVSYSAYVKKRIERKLIQ
jgi:hypothetical protein